MVKIGATSEMPNHIKAMTAQARLGMVSPTTISASKNRSAVRLTPMKMPRAMPTRNARKKPAPTRSRVAAMWTANLPEIRISPTRLKTGIGPGKSDGGKNEAIACQARSMADTEATWTTIGHRRQIDARGAPSIEDDEDFIFWHPLEETEFHVLLEQEGHALDDDPIPSGRVEARNSLGEALDLFIRFDHERPAVFLHDGLRIRLDGGHGVHHRPEQFAGGIRMGSDPILVGPYGEGDHELPGLLSPEAVEAHHLPIPLAGEAAHQRLENHERIQLSTAEERHQHRRRGEGELEILLEIETLHLRDGGQAGVGHGDAIQGADPLSLEVRQAGGRRVFLEHDRVVIDQGWRKEPDLLADQVHPGRRNDREDPGVGPPEDDGLLRRSRVEVLHLENYPVALVQPLLLDDLAQEPHGAPRGGTGEDHLLRRGRRCDSSPGPQGRHGHDHGTRRGHYRPVAPHRVPPRLERPRLLILAIEA